MPNLKVWGESQLSRMKRDMSKRFDALCLDLGLPPIKPFDDHGIHITHEGELLVIKVNAHGMDIEDISVEVQARRLIISGRSITEKDGMKQERAFTRELYLPCPVSAEDANATFAEGKVTVRIPKCAFTTRPIEVTEE